MRRSLAVPFASLLTLAAFALTPPAAHAQSPNEKFHAEVARAAKLSNLDAQSQPFHLKLTTHDTGAGDDAYDAEVEIWWAAPDKWRRSITSSNFSQVAIRNGAKYYESNSPQDYLPYWLNQAIDGVTNPIPVQALTNVIADDDHPSCGNWEIPHGTGDETFSSYASVCFYSNGLAKHIFASSIAIDVASYAPFGARFVPSSFKVFPGGRSTVTATVTVLEPLAVTPNSADASAAPSAPQEPGLFEPRDDSGYASRIRFESVPGSQMVLADPSVLSQLTWPPSFIFPLRGVIVVELNVDRQGNVRNIPSAFSKNQALNDGLRNQMKDWKFKPVVIDGAPVQVVTTIEVPFHLKYEPLGANGKAFPEISFGERIKNFHATQDLRAAGRQPFRLRATITLGDGTTGTYKETWKSPESWQRSASVGKSTLTEKLADGKTESRFNGDDKIEGALRNVFLTMSDRLPELRTFPEQDWGNSVVPASNVNPSAAINSSEAVLIRTARGPADSNNHPTDGQAYWFDSDDVMVASFASKITAVNSNFVPWNGVNVPRKVELYSGPLHIARITIDSIDSK